MTYEIKPEEDGFQEEDDTMIEEFYLYILMRNDMDSLNPGKAVAQGAHAANVFADQMRYTTLFKKEYNKWAGKRGYGTTITLSASKKEIEELDSSNVEYPMDLIIDETYPLKDGKTTHYFPCLTCGYIFAPRGFHGVKHLNLMK